MVTVSGTAVVVAEDAGTERTGREYLEQTISCLHKRLEEVNASLEAGTREIEEMHEYYWENYTEMDQYGYEEFDNRQALLAQVNANQEQLLLRKRYRNMLDSPFLAEWTLYMKATKNGGVLHRIATLPKELEAALLSMTGERL